MAINSSLARLSKIIRIFPKVAIRNPNNLGRRSRVSSLPCRRGLGKVDRIDKSRMGIPMNIYRDRGIYRNM